MTSNKTLMKNLPLRSYKSGEETNIVSFLNLCYGVWGKPDKWQRLYPEYPNFNGDDILIIEDKGEIIGHRGLHFRNLALSRDSSVFTVSSGDTAIHPRHRGSGLDRKLHDTALQMAKTRGAGMAFAWHLKGSASYHRNISSGFIEIRQTPVYAQIIKPEKVLKAGLLNLIHRRGKLREALAKSKELYLVIGNTRLSLAELAGARREDSGKIIEVVLNKNAISSLVNFRSWGRWQRIGSLILFLITGKARVRTNTPGALAKLCVRGLKVLASL